MTWTRRTTALAATVLSIAALGAGVAVAAGGDGSSGDLSRLAEGLRAKDAIAEAVAKELGTTVAELEAAYAAAAEARIAAAVADGSLSKADADLIRAELDEHPGMARRLATPAAIAKELGVSEEKLQAAVTKVHKEQALARIDQAVKDGWLTEKAAAEMKARIESGELPGPGGRHGHGGPGFGGAGPMGFGGHGDGPMGFGGHGDGPMGFGGDGGPSAFEAPSSSNDAEPAAAA